MRWIPKITAALTAWWAAMILFSVTVGWLWWVLVVIAAITLVADEARRHWGKLAQPPPRLLGSPTQRAMPGDVLTWCVQCGKRDIACRCAPPWQRTTDPRSIVTRCAHGNAVEVRRLPVPAVGIADDVVAWYCPDCHEQLPANWTPKPAPAQCRWCGHAHAGDCQASVRASQFLAGVEQLGKTMRAAGVPARPRHIDDIRAGLVAELDGETDPAVRAGLRLKLAIVERVRQRPAGQPMILGDDGPGVVWISEHWHARLPAGYFADVGEFAQVRQIGHVDARERAKAIIEFAMAEGRPLTRYEDEQVGQLCEIVRARQLETREQIEAAGFDPVCVPTLGDRPGCEHHRHVRGESRAS